MAELTEKPGPHRGVLDIAHAEQNFTLRRYVPSAHLAPFIEHFWTIHWDLSGRPDYTSEVLPHPSVNLAFTRERGWITGVTTGKYTYRLEGAGSVLGIQFRPGAFRSFLGKSVASITDKTLPATDIFPAGDDGFRERLLARPSDAEIVADGEALIGARLPAPDPNIDLVNGIIISLPSVAGMSISEATQTLISAGFKVFVGGIRDSRSPAGTVAYTLPAGSAPSGSMVTIYESSGNPPYVPPPPPPPPHQNGGGGPGNGHGNPHGGGR